MKIYLSLVIPCYNEEINIRLGALDKVVRFMDRQKYSWEGLIIDDGSTDESRELIKQFCRENNKFQLIENPHQGKALTVTTGMLKAKGAHVLFMDLDQAVPIEEIEKLLPWFTKGYDIVIGSRKTKRHGAPLLRTIMASGFMTIRNMILGMKDIIDTQCGFKAFTHNSAQSIFSKLQVYHQSRQQLVGSRVTAGFDVEILFVAQKKNMRIKEVEVAWHHVDTRRVNPLRDSLEGIISLTKIKMNDVRGVYE